MKVILAAVTWLALSGAAMAQTATVMIFAGQSNENSYGTATNVFPQTPGGAGTAGVNATAMCFETTTALTGASTGSGTLTCQAPLSGTIYAGQAIVSGGVAGQAVTAGNNGGHFPGATGAGGAGTYAVNHPAAIGAAASPVQMTFTEPDIGGSGTLNPNCQIWTIPRKGAGSWQAYHPRVNSDRAPLTFFGPEGSFCQHWSADNPGKTLYMIKVAVPATYLCDQLNRSFSPEFPNTVTPLAAYKFLVEETQAAEQALSSQLGISNYAVKMIQWGQGENDYEYYCNRPLSTDGLTATPDEYQENLEDLIGRFAIPTAVSASFVGSISGATLTVSSVTSGTIARYQALTGPGVLPETYITGQLSGSTPGGAGVYSLQVYQSSVLTSVGNGTVSCNNSHLTGQFFNALKDGINSCVPAGTFTVGQSLAGPKVLAGTVVTALDSRGDTGSGWYRINVNQTVASEPMTAAVVGWGPGSDTAKFVTYRVVDLTGVPDGVQVAYQSLNDNQGAALNVTAVNVNDALKIVGNSVHFNGAWLAELGRRLYLAYLGQCDYHSPTC